MRLYGGFQGSGKHKGATINDHLVDEKAPINDHLFDEIFLSWSAGEGCKRGGRVSYLSPLSHSIF